MTYTRTKAGRSLCTMHQGGTIITYTTTLVWLTSIGFRNLLEAVLCWIACQPFVKLLASLHLVG